MVQQPSFSQITRSRGSRDERVCDRLLDRGIFLASVQRSQHTVVLSSLPSPSMPRWVPLWLLAQYILLLVDLGDRLRDTSVSCSPRQPMAYKEEFGDLRSSYDLDTHHDRGQQSRPAIKHDIFVKITRKNSPGRLQARSDGKVW